MLICIDAGHGGADPGALGPGGRQEKADNLSYAQELDRQLREQGLETLNIRQDDATMKLENRPAVANSARGDLYLSCHRNAALNPDAGGVEIWLHTDATSKMIQWASLMMDGFCAAGFTARGSNQAGWPAGVKRGHNNGVRENFAVNRLTTMPSMLIELGFITCPADNTLFDKQRSACCAAIVRATCSYLGVRYNTPIDAPPVTDTVPHEKYDALIGAIRELADRFEE